MMRGLPQLAAACLGWLTACSDARDVPGGHADFSGPGEPVARPPAFAESASFTPPVAKPSAISSTFGPRWKTSASRYDFHPGVDYYDALGTPVLAIGAGAVAGLYPEGSPQYPNGGNVLVIEHELPGATTFHGQSAERVFAVYLHLEAFAVAENDTVTAGQVVGQMGKTGDTEFVHLHFETRVQTVCSLPYQTAHPGASCNTGFDPHVHPFLFVGSENTDTFSVEELSVSEGWGARYVASRGDLDLDVIETDLGALGFNERKGIDATSLEQLDDFDYGWVSLVPLPFESASDELVMELHFPKRPGYLELRDIHGVGRRW